MHRSLSVSEFEPASCKELYSAINTRQITALMFHDEMADMFDFLGLQGFKQMHEYQYRVESEEHRALKRYYISHHNCILPQEEVYPEEVIPDEWLKYTRMDVTPPVCKQAVQKAFDQYLEWETDTKALYERCACYLLSWNKVADFNTVNDLVKDVDIELKCLTGIYLRLKSANYDSAYIESIQDHYREKYSIVD